MTDSLWRWSPEYEQQLTGGLNMAAAGELPAIAWARSVKPDLVALQQSTGLPAAGVVAQLLHEAWNPGGWSLSMLAVEFNNFAGMKWAEWQRQYGGRPISMATWEEMDGDRVDLTDAFCAFPSWQAFLQAYSALLNFPRYRGALAYAGQPLLWLHQVWASGWATDGRYLGGLGHWMTATWPIYRDTLPSADPRVGPVRIEDPAGRLLVMGWLQDPDGPGPELLRTVNLTRDLIEAMGLSGEWILGTPPTLRLAWPGVIREEDPK